MKNWTPEEVEFLKEKWGVWSVKSIAKNLGRSESAVQQKASRLRLGGAVTSYEGITLRQLALALQENYYKLRLWAERYGLPAKKKRFKKSPVWVIRIEDFWKWAEKNKHRVNFAKLEENLLGPEPEWVKEKRRADIQGQRKNHDRWTPEEEQRLKALVQSYSYTHAEIARLLNRTEAAVMRKLICLKIKSRPLHRDRKPWTEKEVKTLVELHEKGFGLQMIADQLGRSLFGCKWKLKQLKKAN